MTNLNLENLFFTATEAENQEIIQNLFNILKDQDNLSSDEIVSGIDFVLEAWGDSIESSPVKSKFCLDLALLSPPDSDAYRLSLHRAFNCLKTSAFMKSTIVKVTGIRENNLSIKQIAERFVVLEKIQSGISIFNSQSNRLGRIEQLDEITSEITIKWNTANTATTMTLQAALDNLLFLKKAPALSCTSGKTISDSRSGWEKEIKDSFISVVDHDICKQLAFTMAIEQEIPNNNFNSWWNGDDEKKIDQEAERHPSTARTLHELNTLLLNYSDGQFSEAEQGVLNKTFHKLRLNDTSSEMQMLAESLAILADYIPEEHLVQIAAGVKGQVIFWPQPPDASKNQLFAWEKISVKYLPPVSQLTIDLFSDEYMASLMLLLSFRCWNSIVPLIDKTVLTKSIENASFLSADAILWIWKNRTKLPTATVATISPDALRKALDAAPSSSVQSVKKLFIDDRTFQKELITRITGNEMDLLRGIQACESLRMDEKQSLLVKCSALSPEVKKHIEKGEGKKMFAAAARKHVEKQAAEAADVTSIRSFADMTDNLNDIINKQIPENSAAIAHARSYGDLRENAEYKAAKERQAYLNKRRDEIEKSIIQTQPIDFSMNTPDKIVIPGSTVTLAYKKDNTQELFYLLGVWDSNPDKNYIAYSSGLGKVLNGRNVHDEAILPDGRTAVIVKLEPLPKTLLDNLNIE